MRHIATEAHRLTAHGVLWVFERLIEERIITPSKGHDAPGKLMTLNNRLPKQSCERLLKKWRESS